MSRLVHAIYNIEFEDLGFFKNILKDKQIRIKEYKASSEMDLVKPLKEDIVIIMGGPMSANDEEKYSFIKEELKLIEKHISNKGRVLGICLGAQLIAKVLGSRVYKGEKKEIGWGSLILQNQESCDLLSSLKDVDVLHWHGETFDNPKASTRLASSANFDNQAFIYKNLALGLQFHVEITALGLESWYVGHRNELVEEEIDISKLRKESEEKTLRLEATSINILEKFLSY